MILKRNFNPITVLRYVRFEMLSAIVSACLVHILIIFHYSPPTIPLFVTTIMGSALAIFIAFRNNSSYSRWWEARGHWSGITTASRVLTRLIITFADSHSHQPNYQPDKSEQFKKEIIYLIIAWAHALRIQLRRENSWHEIKQFVSDEDFLDFLKTHNKPTFLHMLIGKKIYSAMASGILGGFDSFQMEGQLLALANYQANCEKIKETPLLRQYDYFIRVFLFVFIALLPFSIHADFVKLGIEILILPITFILAFMFSVLNKVGKVNEDPFENAITDVPMTSICSIIERDAREMLGEGMLPEIHLPQNGYLY